MYIICLYVSISKVIFSICFYSFSFNSIARILSSYWPSSFTLAKDSFYNLLFYSTYCLYFVWSSSSNDIFSSKFYKRDSFSKENCLFIASIWLLRTSFFSFNKFRLLFKFSISLINFSAFSTWLAISSA